MKDYTLDGESRKKFIKDMFLADDGTLTIVFADGTCFHHIANTPENVEKVRKIQEAQAKAGLKNLKRFNRRSYIYGFSSVLGAFASGFLCTGVMDQVYPVIYQNNLASAACIGAAFVIGAAPWLSKFAKTAETVGELKKIQYRNQHRRELDAYLDYPNALSGVENKQHFAYSIEHGEDPFSVLNVDCFSREDLETIVKNVERESEIQFTYQKKISK